MNQMEQEIAVRVSEINEIIKEYLPIIKGTQKLVLEAMHYSVNAGGKRIRPLFMMEIYRLCGGTSKIIEPFAAAIEMIHTYSLVHDDLPAMDNDELRRGRKTTHVVYGEAMGILAGDALLNYAFETAVRAFDMDGDPQRIGKALGILSDKAGVFGMIGGQVVDVLTDDREENLTREELDFIYRLKTGALIEASFMIGAVLAGASEECVKKLETAAAKIGLAFQIQDDILDVIGTEEELGKPIGSDARNHKATYVTFEGMEQAKESVKRLSGEAVAILDMFGERGTFLREFVLSLIERKK